MEHARAFARRQRHSPRLTAAVLIVALASLTPTPATAPALVRTAATTTIVDARLYSASSPSPSVIVAGIGVIGSGRGYWLAATDGRVLTFGAAKVRDPGTSLRTSHPVVATTRTATGDGYWLVTSGGRVFAFGGAHNYGSADGSRLAAPIVAMSATPSGEGYWLVGRDGGVFSFGDARFHGSAKNLGLRAPIVGISSSRSGSGYYLAAADGGVFAFGDAPFRGSAAAYHPTDAVVDIAKSRTGRGYWLVTRDGNVYSFGDAAFYGTLGGSCPDVAVAGIAGGPLVRGYWITLVNGGTFAFSPTSPGVGTCGGTRAQRAARDMFLRTNAERVAAGVPALRWDDTLAAHARAWSAEMSRTGFRHSSLTPLLAGSPPRFNLVAENIAWGRGGGFTSATVHEMWMNSPGHRTNIFHPALQALGVGVACAPDGTLWATENFGRYWTSGPGPGASTPPPGPLAPVDSSATSC